jgi:hypothetical protein
MPTPPYGAGPEQAPERRPGAGPGPCPRGGWS